MLLARRMNLDQQRFGVGPCAPAILLDVPVMRADVVEEPLAFGFVGDEVAEGNIRIVVDTRTFPISKTI
jgi:hypothetical protein